MVYINSREYGVGDNTAEMVASGETALECLTNLVAAINADEIDTENCELTVVEG